MSYKPPTQSLFGMARPHRSLEILLTRPVRTSYLQGVAEKDAEADQTLNTIHDLFVTNMKATKVQQEINKDASEVEKSKKMLKRLSTSKHTSLGGPILKFTNREKVNRN